MSTRLLCPDFLRRRKYYSFRSWSHIPLDLGWDVLRLLLASDGCCRDCGYHGTLYLAKDLLEIVRLKPGLLFIPTETSMPPGLNTQPWKRWWWPWRPQDEIRGSWQLWDVPPQWNRSRLLFLNSRPQSPHLNQRGVSRVSASPLQTGPSQGKSATDFQNGSANLKAIGSAWIFPGIPYRLVSADDSPRCVNLIAQANDWETILHVIAD